MSVRNKASLVTVKYMVGRRQGREVQLWKGHSEPRKQHKQRPRSKNSGKHRLIWDGQRIVHRGVTKLSMSRGQL